MNTIVQKIGPGRLFTIGGRKYKVIAKHPTRAGKWICAILGGDLDDYSATIPDTTIRDAMNKGDK